MFFWNMCICIFWYVSSMCFPLTSYIYNFQAGITENKLKVVPLGTEEYSRAEELRDVFMDFLQHQRELHIRLDAEMKKRSCASDAS